MTDPERYGGPIDPWSPHSLYDVLDGNIPKSEGLEYEGLHILAVQDDEFLVHPDGYVGTATTFEASEYDEVLELVDLLNEVRLEVWDIRDSDARRADYGPQITHDPEKANRDEYVYVE